MRSMKKTAPPLDKHKKEIANRLAVRNYVFSAANKFQLGLLVSGSFFTYTSMKIASEMGGTYT